MGQLRELVQLSDSDRLAIAICVGGSHVGLLYRGDANLSPIYLFHLCWHRIVKNAPPVPNDQCTGCVVPSLEPEQSNAVIAHTLNIWEKNLDGKMPYGFSDPRGFFDVNGNIIFGPNQVGLTCSTIILAIFDLSGTPLVEYDSWPIRSDDADFQRNLLQHLRSHSSQRPEDFEHFKKVESEVGNIRFRPLEVAGSALSEHRPVNFAQAMVLANTVKAWIDGSTVV